MNVLYDDATGEVIGVKIGDTSIPKNILNPDWRNFVVENSKSTNPLDIETPIEVKKPAPEPTVQEELLAMKAIIRGFTYPNEPSTVEEVDLLVKTGWLTEERAEEIKVGK